MKRFPKVSKASEQNEHYQLSCDVAVRTRKNAMKLRQSIQLHCKGNPFTVKSALKSVLSSALVPEKAKEDISCATQRRAKSDLKYFLKTDCCILLSTPHGTL